jgi:hypothetical protein
VTGLAVAGCGHVPSPVGAALPPATRTASPSPHAGSSGQLAPLTGLPATSAAAAARPAVALDIAGRSPHGLAAADVVFEEITSPVRYIAVYQSQEASGIGPITTTEPTDRAVLEVLHPLIGYDGAAAKYFIKFLDSAKITDVSFANHPSAYTSAAGGPVTSTRAIARAGGKAAAPQPLFSYRSPGEATLAASESRRTSARVTLPGLGTQDWVFDSRADRWTLTRGGPKVQAANVIVQTVPYKQIKINPGLGVVVSTAEVVGSGKTEVLSGSVSGGSGGTVAAGTWSKPHPGEITNYFGGSGALMNFEPGPTWVILAPPGTRVRTAGA